jgi:hypothetical protein
LLAYLATKSLSSGISRIQSPHHVAQTQITVASPLIEFELIFNPSMVVKENSGTVFNILFWQELKNNTKARAIICNFIPAIV